jgi:hypothetical protein
MIFCRTLLGLFILSWSCPAQAVQTYQFNENAAIEGVISNTELNRIKIEGERIKQIIGLSKEYKVEGEGQNGQVFIKANGGTAEPAIFSVITEKGMTQDFRLTPKKSKGEIIIIETVSNDKNSKNTVGIKHHTHEEIVEVIKVMAVDGNKKLQKEEEKEEEVEGLSISLLGSHRLNGYLVEVWSVVNNGDEVVELDEKNFRFGIGDIKAIAIEKGELAPFEATTVYVICS